MRPNRLPIRRAYGNVALGLMTVMALAGCQDTLRQIDPSQPPTLTEQVEQCLASCERDHEICLDSAAAERTSGRQFGAAQQCDAGLGQCFDSCRAIGGASG